MRVWLLQVGSLPTLGNILGLFFVLTCMFALLAMQLFGAVAHGHHINEHANFCTFPTAALTLFRCATGEDWNGIMHDAMVSEASGRCSDAAGDCGSWLAIPFFVSYVVLASYIIIKMVGRASVEPSPSPSPHPHPARTVHAAAALRHGGASPR